MPTNECVQCKYNFNAIHLIKDKEVIQLSWQNVISFTVLKNFDEYTHAQYILSLQVDNKTNIWISNNQNSYQVYLDIDKAMFSENGSQVGPADRFVRGFFVAVNTPTASLSQDRMNAIDPTSMNDSSTNDITEMGMPPITIGLIQREMYNCSNSPCNLVAVKDNMQNIVMAMLTRAGFKRVLVSPFQNATMYEDVLVPPLPLFRGIEYLDAKYGFHKAGSIVFYDYDTVYIINTAMTKPATMEKGKNPYLILNIYDDSISSLNGHTRGKDAGIYVTQSTTSIISGENVTNTAGSTVSMVDINSGEKLEVTSNTKNKNALTSKRVVYGNGSPEFLKQRQIENRVRINFAGYHFDASCFKPNTIVSIYHSNPQQQERLRGYFRICDMMTVIQNSGSNFVANSSVTLASCSEK